MKVGLLKEIKNGESRVIMTPSEVSELIHFGHEVVVQTMAGEKAGFSDKMYETAGALILSDMKEVYATSDLVAKVKEVEPEEYNYLRENQIIFACVHPAASPDEVQALLNHKVVAFTAEDTHRFGSPNCEAAGKLGALMGVYNLLSINGGSGQTIFGIGGAPAGTALVLGAGIVGKGAVDILAALGAHTYLMDINVGVLRDAQYLFPKNVTTMISSHSNIQTILGEVDLIINCVKWPKHRKDHLLYRNDLALMKKGSVIVDVSADTDGAIETYRQTSHEEPTYLVDGILHYGVDNIPGAAPHTVSKAYAASIFPHILSIANKGITEACISDGYLRRSMCVYKGIATHEETCVMQNIDFTSPEDVLGIQERTDLNMAPRATQTKIK